MKILKRLVLIVILAGSLAGCKKESAFTSYARPELTIRDNDPRLNANIIHFYKDTVYVIATNLKRSQGQVLLVDAGTLVKVNDYYSITINKGARMEAKGTATAPIVFTSSGYKGTPGFISYQETAGEHSWFGIAIHGNYPAAIDSGSSGTGILSYLRIEFAGSSINNYQGLPGLWLDNVGRGTVVENIEVSYCVKYNSFNISGGNFDGRRLVSYASGGTDFNISGGYRGKLQDLLAYRLPYFSPQIGSGTLLAGLRILDDSTFPAISNLTVLGPDLQAGTNAKYSDTTTAPDFFGNVGGSDVAAFVASSGQFYIRNTVLMGFPKGAIIINDKNTAMSIQYGPSELTHLFIHSNDSSRTFHLRPAVYPPYASADLRDFLARAEFNNQRVIQSAEFKFTDPYSYNAGPNPLPGAGSPVLSGANFDGTIFGDAFFNKVSYCGALGSDDWLKGWTNFIPLQTSYNN